MYVPLSSPFCSLVLCAEFGEVGEDLVAHCSGLEGAAWLEVFEFEVDLAVGLL